MDFDQRSVSVRLDGRSSIEHQLHIHVLDLAEAADNTDIGVLDVLQGLNYVMEYRIQNCRMVHLDAVLMRKLLAGLLQHTAKKRGNLLVQRPTEEADIAFALVAAFGCEVEEFSLAIAQYSPSDLRHSLKIHRRCQPHSTLPQREACARLLAMLVAIPQFSDWRELVKDDEHGDVEALIRATPNIFNPPQTISNTASHIRPPPALYFDKNSERLAEMFISDTKLGLKETQIQDIRKHYGSNKLPVPKRISLLEMIWKQLTDFMIVILILVGITEAATDDVPTSIILFIVVIFNVTIGTAQEYKSNQALDALMTLSVAKASVIRDGKQHSVVSHELVPGDLVVLEEGDAVPADLRLCQVSQLEIIESILTGESLGVTKSIRTIRARTRKLPIGDCKGNAFMTTIVAKGRGMGIVVRTGLNTEIGKISAAITSAPRVSSSIERKLSTLGKLLVALCLLLVIAIILIGIAYKRPVVEMIKTGISLGVSVIPEGLVAVVTVAVALGVSRMAKDHAIVRKASAVETIGSVTVICSDKTGTLTEGKMGAQQIFTSDNYQYRISHSTCLDPLIGNLEIVACEPLDLKSTATIPPQNAPNSMSKSINDMAGPLAASLMVCSLCNNSSVNFDEESKVWKPVGDATEVALTLASRKSGFDKDMLGALLGLRKMGEFAFDSDRKLMSTVYISNGEGIESGLSKDSCFVLCKGAPESVLHGCTSYLLASDQSITTVEYIERCPSAPLDTEFVNYISGKSTMLASSGLRVLALAYRRIDLETAKVIVQGEKPGLAEKDLVFAGLIGLIDPPKEGVKESIRVCKEAGIRVIMITGDHIDTANAIAKQLGILDPSNPQECRSMKGYEIDLLSEEYLAEQTPFPVVFARVSPDNKLKIVKALQRKGHSVIMTGDGVNDAPAIKQADVGVAMGKAGTEITKQAADIVLADDNFSTIVSAIKEGRKVYDNIVKFIVYLLSCNAAEVWVFLIAVSANLGLPFSSLQILVANIFADIPPAMALGLERPEFDIMTRAPRVPQQGIMTWVNITMIIAQSLIMTAITITVFVLSVKTGFGGATSVVAQQSLTFTVLTSMQIVHSFQAKSVTGSILRVDPLDNSWLIFSFVLAFGALILVVEVPGLNSVFDLTSLGGIGWLIVFVCDALVVVLVEVVKLCVRFVFEGKPRPENVGQLRAFVSVLPLVS